MLRLGKTPRHWPRTPSVHTTPTTRTHHKVKSTSKLVSVKPIPASLADHRTLLLSTRKKWSSGGSRSLKLVPSIARISRGYACLTSLSSWASRKKSLDHWNLRLLSFTRAFSDRCTSMGVQELSPHERTVCPFADRLWNQLHIDHGDGPSENRRAYSKSEPRRKGSKEWVRNFASGRTYIRAVVTWRREVA